MIASKFKKANPIEQPNSTTSSTMNLPEPISINSIDSIRNRSTDGICDAISNDSKDDFVDCSRIIYSRDQLINIYKLNNSDDCPDWIRNNPNFPKRLEMQSSENYINKLIEFDCANYRSKRINKPDNVNNNKKEFDSNDEIFPTNEQTFEANNANSRFNRQVGQQENSTKPEYVRNSFGTGNFNNPSNSNHKNNHMGNKFNERSQMFNNRNNDRIEDRNDGRSFLRSRGENLDQNFASFRRFPNRNQNGLNNKPLYHNQHNTEPEWFTDPISQHDTIELKGFDEDEDKLNLIKNSNVQKQQNQAQHHHAQQHQVQKHQVHQQDKNQNRTIQSQNLKNEKQKDDFDLSELTNFDWQSVNANTSQDIKSIDYQANSSRFARWFNEPALVNSSTENQIEKLFSSARNLNNSINSPQSANHTQQQLNLQNDFFGNLMNRSNNSQNLQQQQQQQQQKQQPQQQLIKQQKQQLNDYQQTEVAKLMNTPNKKTDQQLLNILQKARINVDSLMVQQNVINKSNLIKGEVKSAEELEASLLGNVENNNTIKTTREPQVHSQKIHQQHYNPNDLFQKLCSNKNESTTGQSVKNDNVAINPFVLNLLDNAQNKQQNANVSNKTQANSKKKINYLQNMMFTNNQDKVNSFMPTSVIRKFAKEKNSLASGKSTNEANFEIVTGNLINERSILGRENLNMNNENPINQNNLMQKNFTITTGNRWSDNNIQYHRVDSTTSDQEKNEDLKSMNSESLKKILLKASKKPVEPNAFLNNFANKQQQFPINTNQFPKVQNDNQKKLIEILKKASTNYGKTEGGNKINNWFELELKRNNDHLSPIIKENAFTLEDVERT